MSAERRQFRRIPLEAKVGFQEITFSKEPQTGSSVYRDVSGGGLLLNSPNPAALGTLLKLEVRLPGWGRHQSAFGPSAERDLKPLVAVGEVVRLEALEDGNFELGVKFLNVYPDDLEALLRFIEAAGPVEHR
ncbi:MAG: PilZ domain-containing protein [Acidobacteria bacterium]|nr:PilZ domain-containing protein [Acidobacteriota bacterium]